MSSLAGLSSIYDVFARGLFHALWPRRMTRQWRIAVAHLVRGNQLGLHSARCVFVQHDAFRSPPIPWASWIHPGIAASATPPVYRPVSDGTSMPAGIYKGA